MTTSGPAHAIVQSGAGHPPGTEMTISNSWSSHPAQSDA